MNTLLSVMREVRNFFAASEETGHFSISGGIISLNYSYLPGQYILITGSTLNNGIYLLSDSLYTLNGTVDETFDGSVRGLRIPRDFILLCNEISEFNAAEGAPSAFTSESVLGVHSWSKALDKNGAPLGWKSVFASRLAPYRKMFTEVSI